MNKIVKDAIILTIITLVSGCLLGLVYEITKEPIKVAQYKAQQKAYRAVFEEAHEFVDYEGFDMEKASVIVTESGYPQNTIKGVVVAKANDGTSLGYVITVTSHAGYGGDITFSVGITNDGIIRGYSISTIAETVGVGMKVKEEKFSSQFVGKNVEAFEVVKGSAANDSQIEAISGATISSRAITNGIDVALAYFRTILEGGAANE